MKGEYGDVHDWTKSEGEESDLLNAGSLGGRPDLHPWLRDRRNTFEALPESYEGRGAAAGTAAPGFSRVIAERKVRFGES